MTPNGVSQQGEAATWAGRPLELTEVVEGRRCQRLFWWMVREPDAAELAKAPGASARREQKREIRRLAYQRFRGGVTISLDGDVAERARATRAAIDSGAPIVFDAIVVADGVVASANILERVPDGFVLWLVKDLSDIGKHRAELARQAAWQTAVFDRAGMSIRSVRVLHLNGGHRHPDTNELFVSTDLAAAVTKARPSELPGPLGEMVEPLRAVLDGPVPSVPIGTQCRSGGRWCPFLSSPTHRSCSVAYGHVKDLADAALVWRLLAAGTERIQDIPDHPPLAPALERRRRAWKDGQAVVEPTLAKALAPFSGCLGFLDFETIFRALPWVPGTGPWSQVPVQFSYRELQPDGTLRHTEWLADGRADPRHECARRVVEATEHADRIVAYNIDFESGRLLELAEVAASHADALRQVERKLLDLLPVVRDNVYHPGFGGGFSLKQVLTPLVPGLSYDDLEIRDGDQASQELWRLMNPNGSLTEAERTILRTSLKAYCGRDTEALVRLLRRLRELAGLAP